MTFSITAAALQTLCSHRALGWERIPCWATEFAEFTGRSSFDGSPPLPHLPVSPVLTGRSWTQHWVRRKPDMTEEANGSKSLNASCEYSASNCSHLIDSLVRVIFFMTDNDDKKCREKFQWKRFKEKNLSQYILSLKQQKSVWVWKTHLNVIFKTFYFVSCKLHMNLFFKSAELTSGLRHVNSFLF